MNLLRRIDPRRARLSGLLAMVAAVPGLAEPLTVFVRDRDGNPVEDVAVYATWPGSPAARPEIPTAIMDQRNTQFVPHVLVVQKGTAVEFPNSDVVAHHVYSFSKPNDFVLPLYKGDPNDPITFEHTGVVTLGCNIHDQMLGYIIVVDTAAFGKSDGSGRVDVDIPDAVTAATVSIWSPRIVDDPRSLSREWLPPATDITITLHEKLRRPHDSAAKSLLWSEY